MIPAHQLHEQMQTAEAILVRSGSLMWQRADDWRKHKRLPNDSTRGGGTGEAVGLDKMRERMEDQQAGAYYDELATLSDRLSADLNRLRFLEKILVPDKPRPLRPGDMTTAQLIADGWCPSCFRDNDHLAPLAEGRYSDRCRPCGETRGRERRDPTLEELRIMHAKGKSLRQRIVDTIRSA